MSILNHCQKGVTQKKDPEAFLDSIGEKAIIDEVQNVPVLLSQIQIRVDYDKSIRYVLTGSCNFSLLQTVSQSLAGIATLFTLLPLSLRELSKRYIDSSFDDIAFNGFYPGVICGGSPAEAFYMNYYDTYIERDIRNLMKIKHLDLFDKFVHLLAGRASTEFNASSLAVEVGVSELHSPTSMLLPICTINKAISCISYFVK